ncbi:hypothetical protein JXA12_01640 [Candidatus Woesearchaeota archaeon]|nr:hypothetical protein [Candidatus Woesearchaeota archaeon]
MAFSKPFPKRSDKSVYPQWEDVTLTPEEEAKAEKACREANQKIMAECLEDAEKLLVGKGLKGYETSMTQVAASLFEKRASHVAYWKEELAREKFEKRQ